MPFIGGPTSIWYVLKIILLLFTFIWVRGTIPRYRYDQIMAVAWKYLIPFTLVVSPWRPSCASWPEGGRP